MTLFIIILLLVLIAHPFLHHILIQKQVQIDHPFQTLFLITIILGICIVFLISGLSWDQIYPVLIPLPPFRWLIHDAILNLLRNKSVNYLGTSALTDRFLRTLQEESGWSPIAVKFTIYLFSLMISIFLST